MSMIERHIAGCLAVALLAATVVPCSGSARAAEHAAALDSPARHAQHTAIAPAHPDHGIHSGSHHAPAIEADALIGALGSCGCGMRGDSTAPVDRLANALLAAAASHEHHPAYAVISVDEPIIPADRATPIDHVPILA
jgi:hypothetical protein